VKIEHVMHGDAELWARLGEFFASRDVHKALGGPITVIVKPGVGHHPHSLKDPQPIVDFVYKHTAALDK